MHRSTARSHFQIQRDVIYALLLRELSSTFGKNRGGYFWALVEPLAHLLVPVFIFTFIRQRLIPGVEYPVFLVYGFLPFLLFKSICMQMINGVNQTKGLLAYRQVLLMDVFGFDVLPPRPLELVAVLALTVMFAFGLGLVLAAIASLIPDARSVISIMFMPLYFISGILFPVTRFPDEWMQRLAFNPVLHLVELSRSMAVEGYEPFKYLSLTYPVTLAITLTAVGLMLYRLRFLARVTP
ncbi:MAG: ABC transporter permease [Gammaproteobacteria bacterium]